MPELPEVETVRRGLDPALVGARFDARRDAAGRSARPLPQALRRTADRPKDRSLDAARQVSARRARRRRDAGHASRHVRLVPRRAQRRDPRARRSTTSARNSPRTTTSSSRSMTARASSTTIPGASARWILAPTKGLADHPLFRDLGVEPLSAEFDAAQARRGPGRRAHAAQERAARPEAHRRARQHLRLRGAAPRAAFAAARGGDPRRRQGRADASRQGPGRRRFARCSRRRSQRAVRPYAIIARPTANSAISSTPSRSTIAKARPARDARCRGVIARIVQSGRSTFYCPACQK